jgi:hypothetical protein
VELYIGLVRNQRLCRTLGRLGSVVGFYHVYIRPLERDPCNQVHESGPCDLDLVFRVVGSSVRLQKEVVDPSNMLVVKCRHGGDGGNHVESECNRLDLKVS